MDEVASVVDAKGQKCPMPVVMLARAIRGLPAGALVEVHSDDPAACHDIPAWCRMRDATYVGVTREGDVDVHRIQLAV
jgi:tRNA 2-thiouridine synthesizing protein A